MAPAPRVVVVTILALENSDVDSAALRTMNQVPGQRRRPPRRIILVCVAALVAIGVLALIQVAAGYQPIRLGDAVYYDGTTRIIESPDGKSLRVFRFEPSVEFGYSLSITNTGSFSVRVTDIPATASDPYAERIGVDASVDLEPNVDTGAPTSWQAFEPFTLDPGEARSIRFRYRFTACDLAADSADPPPDTTTVVVRRWDRQTVDFEFSGFGHTARLDLLSPIAIEAAGRCPE